MSRSIISNNKDVIKQSSGNEVINQSKTKSSVINPYNPKGHKKMIKSADSEVMRKAIKNDMSSSLKNNDKRGIGNQNKPKKYSVTQRDKIYQKSIKKSFSKTAELREAAKYGVKYTAKAAEYTAKAGNKIILPAAENAARNIGKGVMLTVLESDKGEIQNATNKAIITEKTVATTKKTVKAAKKTTKATYKTTKLAVKASVSAVKAALKTTIAIVSFVIANLPVILAVLAAALVVISLITIITSIFSISNLKSDDTELTKAYSYMTELDSRLTTEIVNYQYVTGNDIQIYVNNTACDIDDFEIKTDVDLVLAWFDAEYEDYAFDAFIYGVLGGNNIKEEIEEIWRDLYYYKTEQSYDKDKKKFIQKIYVNCEPFEDFVSRNIPENEDAYELMKEVGIFTTKAELMKPFEFDSVLNRYGYYPHTVTNSMNGSESMCLFSHKGMDIKADEGTPVKSGLSGKVGFAGYSPVQGYYVIISNPTDKKSIMYCKLIEGLAVKQGQEVGRGDVIGYVGNTGTICSDFGACLHIEYYKDGKSVVPSMYFIGGSSDSSGSQNKIIPGGGNGTFRYPTYSRAVSAGYPTYSDGTYHGGVDFPVPVNTDVCAAADGKVIFSGTAPPDNNGGYGNYVVLEHKIDGRTIITLYGHNTTLLVKYGDTVKRGQVIAKSGSTGNSTGPHVHFEVQLDKLWGSRVNPFLYLEK